jgi:threonine dehydrogenase-like Zn-dependent dehydrogenase
VQFAALAGGHVIAVDIDDRKLALARQFGARDVLNARGIERVDKELKKRTGGGVDVAMEIIGKPETIRNAYESLRPGGRLCQVGYTAEPVTLAFSKMMFYELQVIGSLGCRPSDYPELIELVRTRRAQLEPLVTGRYTLERITDGLDTLRRGEGIRGIVVMDQPQ